MRILALETNLAKLKSQYIAEGEEELFSTSRHVARFVLPMAGIIPLTVALFAAYFYLGVLGVINAFILTIILAIALLVPFSLFLKAIIDWQCNWVIITTEKIVVIHHQFFFNQEIRPIHIENIKSTQTQSQMLGFGNYGTVMLILTETQAGTNELLEIDYLHKPDAVAGIIENAIVLKKQRVPADKGPEAQQQKVEEVKVKSDTELPENVTSV